jgi:hypothetical protein
VLILARNEAISQLNEIIVVPARRTIRGLTSEIYAISRMPDGRTFGERFS